MDLFINLFDKFAEALINVLPTSPFQQYIEAFADLPYLGFLNWFIPIRSFVNIGMAWLSCITIFYLYSIVMRWLKMIGD